VATLRGGAGILVGLRFGENVVFELKALCLCDLVCGYLQIEIYLITCSKDVMCVGGFVSSELEESL
jgi:hypothetical protein